jgi:hypothetical protein
MGNKHRLLGLPEFLFALSLSRRRNPAVRPELVGPMRVRSAISRLVAAPVIPWSHEGQVCHIPSCGGASDPVIGKWETSRVLGRTGLCVCTGRPFDKLRANGRVLRVPDIA